MARKPKYQVEIAKDRINILFEQAESEFKEHPERSHRYVEIARNIAMKFNLSITKKIQEKVLQEMLSLFGSRGELFSQAWFETFKESNKMPGMWRDNEVSLQGLIFLKDN